LATAHALPRVAKRNSNHIPAAVDHSIALRAMRAPKITTPDINRIRSDHVIFVRPALFAPVFVTRGCGPPRAPSAEQSFIRQTKQRRAHFVADVSITERSDRCAEGQVAEMPFASPYCPSPAQIRRVHVQSRTRLAVLPSMRVRSHASRLARAHHFTIPKIRGDRL
jgi:hypothetical protein